MVLEEGVRAHKKHALLAHEGMHEGRTCPRIATLYPISVGQQVGQGYSMSGRRYIPFSAGKPRCACSRSILFKVVSPAMCRGLAAGSQRC